MDLKKFRMKPLMGILRGLLPEELEPLFDTILLSGLETVEITLNTPGAFKLIRRASRLYGKKLMIGAGTVLTVTDLRKALDAGATFIVSPVLVRPVARECVKRKIPVFPGALTPREVYDAWTAGASMVKIFPSGCLGPGYFRELKGPFRDVELLACSGVTPENVGEYFRSGASAVAVGSGIFRRDWIQSRKFTLIRDKIQAYLKGFPE
ncbi:MAG TPA: bifunctional 4-hydroxy-2-oxoglutarate aldolase/2-dehydro-3-deoxy-phosphogluconate aldolase [Candidatus Omnitrophota bacterium]|nr:bifunctional 4-hydroxy-2-oxoglutarate aldolase/2-dehydro-3-deoxy-phosphogluconate aldolase [Candidatus Omnitrophota bacterium]